MEDWELREPAMCRALTQMQYDVMGAKDAEDIIAMCRITKADYSRLYDECFRQVDQFIKSIQLEKESLQAQVIMKNEQIQAYKSASVFK